MTLQACWQFLSSKYVCLSFYNFNFYKNATFLIFFVLVLSTSYKLWGKLWFFKIHFSNLPLAHSRDIPCSLTSHIFPVTPSLNSFFNAMSTFYVISKGFPLKLAKPINQLMQPIVTLLKYYVMLFLLIYKLSWQLPVYCYNFIYKVVWLAAYISSVVARMAWKLAAYIPSVVAHIAHIAHIAHLSSSLECELVDWFLCNGDFFWGECSSNQ